MGTVVKLKNQINDSHFLLKDSVEDKLILTEERIKSKLASDVQLVQKMTDYHIETGGKRLRAFYTIYRKISGNIIFWKNCNKT